MADLKSFINTSSDRIKSAMGVPVDRIKTIQGSKLNQLKPTTKAKFLFLWTGKFDGDNLLSDIDSSVITVTNKDFSTSYIPASSTATFSIPDNSTYKTADEDLFWSDGSNVLQKTTAQLVQYDYSRTFIKYSNASPYDIQSIGILKSGETLTAIEIDEVHKYFRLWIYWSSVLNINGYIKENRDISSIPLVINSYIENNNPNIVNISFDQLLTDELIPDVSAFNIIDKIINNVSIIDNIVKLTTTENFQINDIVTVSYSKPTPNPLTSLIGACKVASFTDITVINNIDHPLLLEDTNTIGWYDFNMNITKNSSDYVSQWGDRSSYAHHLSNGIKSKPKYTLDGIVFGETLSTDQLYSSNFGMPQPYTVFMVVKEMTWVSDRFLICDSNNSYNGTIGQKSGGVSPTLVLYCGSVACDNIDLAIGSWGIINAVFNGSSSALKIDNNTEKTGNPGTGNPGGIRIGGHIGLNKGAYFYVKEIIYRTGVDSESDRTILREYLQHKYTL